MINLERLQELSAAILKEDLLKTLVPIPGPLQMTTAPNSDKEQAALLEEQYGYTDWYNFCLARWGTKWDIGHVQIGNVEKNSISFSFDTAWSPPTNFYDKMVDLGFDIEAMFYEGGCCFCGRYDEDGDSYYQWKDLESARKTIPMDIDEEFCISEMLEEWEEEEDEE